MSSKKLQSPGGGGGGLKKELKLWAWGHFDFCILL